MAAREPDGSVWHTSSYSSDSGTCVEVVPTLAAVLVRDSKDRVSPVLTVRATSWQALLTTVTH